MSTSHSRMRALAAPLFLGLLGLLGTGCWSPPPSAPYYGIYFYPPSVGYIGKTYTPTATATSGLPVTFALDPSSTGCTFGGGVVNFVAEGTCLINANQAGDATHDPSAQVQGTIGVHNCPPLRSGVWTGPLGLSAVVIVNGSTFTGSVDLSSLGYGVQSFGGTVACEVATMTFNSTPLAGVLSYDGSTLSSSYQGISIVLHAPA